MSEKSPKAGVFADSRANAVTDRSFATEKVQASTGEPQTAPKHLIGNLAPEERQCTVTNPAMKPGVKGLAASRFATEEERKTLRFGDKGPDPASH